MPLFNVLFIKEFYHDGSDTDQNIFILYDTSDNNYYYYGTRARDSDPKNKFINYSGKYSYHLTQNFLNFLNILIEDCSKITTELYQVEIDEHEYDSLDFTYLKRKCNIYNMLAAYDDQHDVSKKIREAVNLLVTDIPESYY